MDAINELKKFGFHNFYYKNFSVSLTACNVYQFYYYLHFFG